MGGKQTPPGAAPLSGGKQIAAGTPRTFPVGNPFADAEAFAEVIDQLARGDETVADIASRWKVSRNWIYILRTRYQDEIDERRRVLGSRVTDLGNLWIADKVARVGELQRIYERIDGMFTEATAENAPELARTLLGVLHEAAEQLGQLPTRVQVTQNTTVQYQLVGVDTDQL